MAIKGLTDRGSAFPEIGQIRKGAAKQAGENRPGKDLPYFRVEFDGNDPRGQKFVTVYGPQPADINIILPFNEIDRNWDAWYEAYTAGRMVARSDGEHFTYLADIKTGEHVVINGLDKNGQPVAHREVVGEYKTQGGKTELIKMKPVGRLKVVVPELQSLAYLTVHTTSIYDIMNISSQLEAIQQMNSGRIAGVPLVMRRRKKMISTPDLNDKTKRLRREKYLISIEADPEWVKQMLMHVKHLALPGNGLALLPAGTPEPEEKFDNLPAGSDNDEEDDPDAYPDAYGDDVRDGQFEDALQPEPEPAPEPVANSGTAALIVADIKAAMSLYTLRPKIDAAKINMLAPFIESAFDAGDKEGKRHAALKAITGSPSIKDLSVETASCLFHWLRPYTDAAKVWHVNDQAKGRLVQLVAELDKQNQTALI